VNARSRSSRGLYNACPRAASLSRDRDDQGLDFGIAKTAIEGSVGRTGPIAQSLTSTAGRVIPVPGASAEAFGVALVGPHILIAGIAYGTPNRLFLARYFR